MSSQQSLLARHRTAITVITAAAVVLSILAMTGAASPRTASKPLRRRNAVRRSRRLPQVRLILNSANDRTFGVLAISLDGHTTALTIDLAHESSSYLSALPTIDNLAAVLGTDVQTAATVYERLAKVAVTAVLRACTAHDLAVLPNEGTWSFTRQLTLDLALEATHPTQIVQRYAESISRALGSPLLEDLVTIAILEHLPEVPHRAMSQQRHTESSTQGATDELKGVLYYIAEEQAKRKAYQHRGIRCEECGESPIRNVRWHCLNCPDFDLCSTCKSLTAHQKNHIFAEIKIPLPVLAQPTGILPSWYPGSDIAVAKTLSAADRRTLAQAYECDEPEIDALADQFMCFANTAAITEPAYIAAAIDRHAFSRAISSEKWRNKFHSNLFCNRMFAFYNSTKSDRIGFEQFVAGSCYLRGKRRNDPSHLHRALEVFDLNEDGLFCRSHFRRVLKAKYDLHRVLIGEIAEAEEAERTRQAAHLLHGDQPIGTIFHAEIPQGQSRRHLNKAEDSLHDLSPGPIVLDDAAKLSAEEHDRDAISDLTIEERTLLGLNSAEPERQRRIVDEALLWDVIDESLNEVLDKIFKPTEERLADMIATKDEREQWNTLIDRELAELTRFSQDLSSSAETNPLVATAKQTFQQSVASQDLPALQLALRQDMVSTDAGALDRMEASLHQRPLQSLLEEAGYSIDTEASTLRNQVDGSEASLTEVTGSVGPTKTHSSSITLDPTMPQNKPDSAAEHQLHRASATPPSDMRLRHLALLTLDERRLHTHNGEACMTKAQIVGIATSDQSRAVEGLIRSWISWAAF